jgi:hypothetical protein
MGPHDRPTPAVRIREGADLLEFGSAAIGHPENSERPLRPTTPHEQILGPASQPSLVVFSTVHDSVLPPSPQKRTVHGYIRRLVLHARGLCRLASMTRKGAHAHPCGVRESGFMLRSRIRG